MRFTSLITRWSRPWRTTGGKNRNLAMVSCTVRNTTMASGVGNLSLVCLFMNHSSAHSGACAVKNAVHSQPNSRAPHMYHMMISCASPLARKHAVVAASRLAVDGFGGFLDFDPFDGNAVVDPSMIGS